MKLTGRRMDRGRWYWYVPGGGADGILGWLEALKWNWRKFQTWAPLLTLFAPGWWRMVWRDAFPREDHPFKDQRFRTCYCGRTWFRYRLLPALVGDKRFGGGC